VVEDMMKQQNRKVEREIGDTAQSQRKMKLGRGKELGAL